MMSIEAEAILELARIADPANLMLDLGLEPDPWQTRALRSRAKRVMLLCTRQGGKSTTTAVKALHTALYRPPSLVLLVSPSQRQSDELFAKVSAFYRTLGSPRPAVTDREDTLELANGSRIVALPDSPDKIRGFSAVTLLVVDEAAMARDELFTAVTPALAASNGDFWMLSTPKGMRGRFFDDWERNLPNCERIRVTADDCPRISPEFLENERLTMDERTFMQEYYCVFSSSSDQVFDTEQIRAAMDGAIEPLYPGGL